MAIKRPCLGMPRDPCGRKTARGSRCPIHTRAWNALHHNRAYDDPRYRALRTEVLSAWRAEHGNLCPGDSRHPAHDVVLPDILTLDHVVSLVRGGDLLDPANLRVCCRSGNGAKGAR